MATIDQLKKKDGSAVNAGVSQIPAGAGSTPAPAFDGKSDTELGRQVKNTLSALPGAGSALSAIPNLARAVPAVGSAISGATGTASKAASLLGKVAPYGVPAGGFAALSSASQPSVQPSAQAAMAAGASANPAAPAQANPNVAPPAAPGAPTAQAPSAMQAMSTAPSGVVTRVGNSYSGNNVSGDISINGAPPRGGMISAQNSQAAGALSGGSPMSAGYAADLKQLAGIEAGKAEQNANMQAQAAYAKQGADEYRRSAQNLTDITSPEYRYLRSLKMEADAAPKGRGGNAARSEAAQLQAQFLSDLQGGGRKSEQATAQDATTRRGQDITAANQTATQKLADKRFGLDSAKAGQDATNAGIENEAKNLALNAQKAFLNAKTPEEQKSALAVLSGLSGKERTQQAQYSYAPGGQSVDPVTGEKITQPGVIFNQFTGETTQPGQKQALPPGMVKQVGTSNGKPVYEDANGKRHQ